MITSTGALQSRCVCEYISQLAQKSPWAHWKSIVPIITNNHSLDTAHTHMLQWKMAHLTDVECVDLNDVQNKHFVASSIKDLFDNIEAHKIIDFIKETRFYKQL